MGPAIQACHNLSNDQEAKSHLGCRICLLKGCDRTYRPNHPLRRYCSESCVRAAARWRQCDANRRYRASEGGKRARSAQSSRYRQRIGERNTAEQSPLASGEGYGYGAPDKKVRCHRPGCYVRFERTLAQPLRKFCNSECRQALRRVLVRERRWFRTWLRNRLKGFHPAASS